VGARSVPGLHSSVKVRWTDGGIPHLSASDARDVVFAQGYLTASERFFQMDMSRRTMRGELAAVLGDRPAPWRNLSAVFEGMSLADVDHFLRQLAIVPVASASLEKHSAEARSLLDAYAAGVNAWLSSSSRPLECALLGYDPEPWRPGDSIVVWKGLAFQLSWGWRTGLFAEAVAHRFSDAPGKARALLADEPRLRAEHSNGTNAGKLLGILEGVAGPRAPGSAGLGGSNAWALAPSRTTSGRPIVCGDPHLPFRAPASGYLVHLSGGDLDVAGWSVPGLPGVFMGHNAHVAWGITNGAAQDATWARESLRTAEDGLRLVKTASDWSPVRAEDCAIDVKGRSTPQHRLLAFTDNGPLFGGHLARLDDDSGLALRWTGHLPTADMDGMLAMNRARSGDDVKRACGLLGAPVVNVVWGDTNGHVGWRMGGAAPRFPGGVAPVFAAQGWDHGGDWQGLVPPEDMPARTDPVDGVIVSANEAPPADGPVRGTLFQPPWRALRLRTLLQGTRKLTLDDAMAPQHDLESGFGLAFRDRFVRPFRARLMDGDARRMPLGDALEVLDLSAGWNGHAESSSRHGAAAWAFAQALLRRVFADPLGEHLFAAWGELYHLLLLPFLDVLAADGAPFVAPGAWESTVRGALDDAASRLRTVCGGPGAWELGAMRTLKVTHTFSDVPALGALFTLGPVPFGGDGSTACMVAFRLDGDGEAAAGPVFRQGVEVGDWDGYRVVLLTGQSGDPSTARYRDHWEKWLDSATFILPFSDVAIDADTRFSGELVASAPPVDDAGAAR